MNCVCVHGWLFWTVGKRVIRRGNHKMDPILVYISWPSNLLLRAWSNFWCLKSKDTNSLREAKICPHATETWNKIALLTEVLQEKLLELFCNWTGHNFSTFQFSTLEWNPCLQIEGATIFQLSNSHHGSNKLTSTQKRFYPDMWLLRLRKREERPRYGTHSLAWCFNI